MTVPWTVDMVSTLPTMSESPEESINFTARKSSSNRLGFIRKISLSIEERSSDAVWWSISHIMAATSRSPALDSLKQFLFISLS